jgi:septal ring factor EnvC (AmiA/AmiB activator)
MSGVSHGNCHRAILHPRSWHAGLVVFGLLVWQTGSGVVAQEADLAAQENLNKIRTSIAELQKFLSSKTVEFEGARSQVLEIERRLHLARRENNNFTRELAAKNLKIAALTERRETLKREYSKTARAVSDIVVAKYRLSHEPKLKLLLNSTDIPELQRNLKYLDYVASLNNDFLTRQTHRIGELDNIESALKLEANKLRHLQVRSSEHLSTLSEALNERNTLATTLEKLVKNNERELGVLIDDENQLEKLVDEVTETHVEDHAASAPFKGRKGKLSWPTVGRIAKAPGGAMRAGGAKWGGVIIESTPGSDVRAIASGRIAFADWFRNLGLLVIVDHSDGYMSLYGHNQEIYKSTGERVDAGEILSTVGDTGGRTTTGVYFEIRQNGLPEDPRHWCKR